MQAATDLGAVRAGANPVDQPPECGMTVPHAPRVVGQEVLSVLKLEGGQLDKANGVIRRCHDFNEAQIEGLRGTETD